MDFVLTPSSVKLNEVSMENAELMFMLVIIVMHAVDPFFLNIILVRFTYGTISVSCALWVTAQGTGHVLIHEV